MNDTPSRPKDTALKDGGKAPKSHAQARAERLQAALRENLRRRKAAAAPVDGNAASGDKKAGQNDV